MDGKNAVYKAPKRRPMASAEKNSTHWEKARPLALAGRILKWAVVFEGHWKIWFVSKDQNSFKE